MIKIREYDKSDWGMLAEWWKAVDMEPPEKKVIPFTTYILSIDDVPALSLSLILTNTCVGWLDNFIGNPDVDKKERREAAKILVTAVEIEAKQFGYDRTFCMATEPKLAAYYESLGYRKTYSAMHTLIKEI